MMEEPPCSAPAFPSFSCLPLELREQIWSEALPSVDAPALYFYRKWCLSPGPLTNDTEPESDQTTLHSRHETPRKVQLNAPSLSFVNHEARKVVARWMRDRRIINQGCPGGQGQIFVRGFEPGLDIVCVAPSKWLEFLTELYDRYFAPNLLTQHRTIHSMDLRYLALCHTLPTRDLSPIPGIYYILNQLEVLIIVLNMPVSAARTKTQPNDSYRLTIIQGWGLHWNPQTGDFEPESDQPLGDQKIYGLFERAVTGLQSTLNNIDQSIRQLEIRAAYIPQ
uniref:2EXR domain-containing protein n=1 Tax=Bionectria ochroleuca TaxID=29856 RepID=A0A8H7N084_BIOOC